MKIRPLIAVLAIAVPAIVHAAGGVVMHRDPGCPCCAKWSAQVEKAFGRKVQVLDDQARAAFQREAGIPAKLSSCHSAVIDGYVFEGHVPIADMKRLLAQKPKGVKGLAVAGMPMGSPGMEVPGRAAQPYDVIAFGPGGEKVFAHHGG